MRRVLEQQVAKGNRDECVDFPVPHVVERDSRGLSPGARLQAYREAF